MAEPGRVRGRHRRHQPPPRPGLHAAGHLLRVAGGRRARGARRRRRLRAAGAGDDHRAGRALPRGIAAGGDPRRGRRGRSRGGRGGRARRGRADPGQQVAGVRRWRAAVDRLRPGGRARRRLGGTVARGGAPRLRRSGGDPARSRPCPTLPSAALMARARAAGRRDGRARRPGLDGAEGRGPLLRGRVRDRPPDAVRRGEPELDDRRPVPERGGTGSGHAGAGGAHGGRGGLRGGRGRRRPAGGRGGVRAVVLVRAPRRAAIRPAEAKRPRARVPGRCGPGGDRGDHRLGRSPLR